MSRAEKRNGERVYKAALWATSTKGEMGKTFITVGEVAEIAGMGKATARKYMDFMAEQGTIERTTVTPTMVIYRFI